MRNGLAIRELFNLVHKFIKKKWPTPPLDYSLRCFDIEAKYGQGEALKELKMSDSACRLLLYDNELRIEGNFYAHQFSLERIFEAVSSRFETEDYEPLKELYGLIWQSRASAADDIWSPDKFKEGKVVSK